MSNSSKVQWILLGLLMLIPGILKLVVMKPAAISSMLGGIVLFAWAPTFWAWVLILSEIVFGVLILARWNLKYTTIPPMIILAIATLFVTIKWDALAETQVGSVIFHLIGITGYWMLCEQSK